MMGTTECHKHQIDQTQRDEAVGQIKGRPARRPQPYLQEIRNPPIEKPVGKIADTAAQQNPNRPAGPGRDFAGS
jgi:hypothetical protein